MISTPQDSSAGAAIGIDVGGTKVAVGVVTRAGELLASHRLEVAAAPSFASLLDEAAARARELRKVLGEERVVGVGVGMPELVDPAGEVRTSSVIPWSRRDLVRAFGALGPVLVQADVRAAALAEARFGAGRNWSSFVYVTVGTGISCSLVQNGRPYPAPMAPPSCSDRDGLRCAAPIATCSQRPLRWRTTPADRPCSTGSGSGPVAGCAGLRRCSHRRRPGTSPPLKSSVSRRMPSARSSLSSSACSTLSASSSGVALGWPGLVLGPAGLIYARAHLGRICEIDPDRAGGPRHECRGHRAGHEAIISRQRTTEPAPGPSVRDEEGTDSKEVRAC